MKIINTRLIITYKWRLEKEFERVMDNTPNVVRNSEHGHLESCILLLKELLTPLSMKKHSLNSDISSFKKEKTKDSLNGLKLSAISTLNEVGIQYLKNDIKKIREMDMKSLENHQIKQRFSYDQFMESIRSVLEYHRYPLTWSELSYNTPELKELFENVDNCIKAYDRIRPSNRLSKNDNIYMRELKEVVKPCIKKRDGFTDPAKVYEFEQGSLLENYDFYEKEIFPSKNTLKEAAIYTPVIRMLKGDEFKKIYGTFPNQISLFKFFELGYLSSGSIRKMAKTYDKNYGYLNIIENQTHFSQLINQETVITAINFFELEHRSYKVSIDFDQEDVFAETSRLASKRYKEQNTFSKSTSIYDLLDITYYTKFVCEEKQQQLEDDVEKMILILDSYAAYCYLIEDFRSSF